MIRILTFALAIAAAFPADAAIRDVGIDDHSGLARAVVVGDLPTCYTSQIYPVDDSGQLAAADAAAQVAVLFQRLDRQLEALKPQAPTVVRLNFYLDNDDLRTTVERALADRYRNRKIAPSGTFMTGAIGREGVKVTVDAVIALENSPDRTAVELSPDPAGPGRTEAAFAIMPAGRRVYFGGRGFKGADPAAAARDSLRRLDYTLRFAGVDRSAIVSVRAWIDPILSRSAVEKEIQAFFGGHRLPPVIFVGYTSYVGLEIDLVGYGGPATSGGETVDYLTPPEDQAHPAKGFSRIARINRGATIYASSLLGGRRGLKTDAFAVDAFIQLDELMASCGSDLRHLAKGVLYVVDQPAYQSLNRQRYKNFDPKRAPAVTQLTVAGVGSPVCTISLDIIAGSAP